MGYHQQKQYLHYENPRRKEKEKGTKSTFKAIMTGKFSKLEREMTDP